MSGFGAAAMERTFAAPIEALLDINGHRHGRWTGLFKLSEEAGEAVVAAIDVLHADHEALPVFLAALENEIADLGAAGLHVIDANGLDLDRIDARRHRQIGRIDEGRVCSLSALVRRCGVLVQLLGKIAAFPNGDEHPDAAGNLTGRIEVAIADTMAAASHAITQCALDAGRIETRGAEKLALFRAWFPAGERGR